MSQTSFTVLTADDAKVIRQMVKNVLKSCGITNILEAINGEEALRLVQSHKVDLIISDWNMPKVTGQEFLEAVRADEKTKHIPFVMLTAEADKTKVVTAISAGVSNYVVKPFTVDNLHKKIRQFLPESCRELKT
jgi:two-component system chemotaxis response regulator CheY